MVYMVEESLTEFEAWAGGFDTWKQLTADQLDAIEARFVDYFGEEPTTRTAINDFLWYQRDLIAALLGFDSWDELTEYNAY